jgi:quercetin dioxygenase-like cupin family protein
MVAAVRPNERVFRSFGLLSDLLAKTDIKLETMKNSDEVNYKRRTDLENTYAYMGSLMTFLVEGRDTGGQFALMEYRAKPGNEPPPHWHEFEDETLYVLEGELEAYLGDQILRIGPGEVLFIPRGQLRIAFAGECASLP